MQPPDPQLLAIVADAEARKVTAADFDLPSGAIPVLLALNLAGGCHPSCIQAAKIATPTLVRAYLAELVRQKLIERTANGRNRYLRLTLAGLGVIGRYQRALRTSAQRFTKAACIF